MIYYPANEARARGSGLTQEQRQAGQMAQQMQQGQYALPPPNPEAYVPLIPQYEARVPLIPEYVHRMGFGEISLFVPPQPSPAPAIRDIPMYPQRRRSRSNSAGRIRSVPPTDRNMEEDRPNLRRGLGIAPAATVAPTPQRRSSRSNSRGGLRTRWESEGNPFAGVARRGQLGDTPFVPVAPVAPKMAPRPVDPNVRLRYPPSMPAPQAIAAQPQQEPPQRARPRPSRATPMAMANLPKPKPVRLGSVPSKRDRTWPSPERRQKPRPSLRSDKPRRPLK